MRNPKLNYIVLFLFILLVVDIHAQESILVTGGKGSGSGGSVSYSVGQVFYHTPPGSKLVLSEGVQHPYYVIKFNTSSEAKVIDLFVQAYPNPATHILNLVIDNFISRNMAYYIIDIQGKILQHVKITAQKTSIEMGQLPPSAYILNVVEGNQLIKSFKIIKE